MSCIGDCLWEVPCYASSVGSIQRHWRWHLAGNRLAKGSNCLESQAKPKVLTAPKVKNAEVVVS